MPTRTSRATPSSGTHSTEYVEYPPGSGQGTELYKLTTDPNELVNRTNDPLLAQVKASLAARLRALRTE